MHLIHQTNTAPARLLILLALCQGFTAGCSTPALAAPASKPAAILLRMHEAVDLNQLTAAAEPYLSHQLRLSRGGRIYFGTLGTYDADDQQKTSIPIIARSNGGKWIALPLLDQRLKDAGWSYVGGGPNRGEIWGVLDAALQNDQPELLLVHSTDGGETFALSALHKPDPAAEFDSFRLGPDGSGRITLYLQPDANAKTSHPGYYNYLSTDGGGNWSSPEYEPDAMFPAPEVPDADQPASAASAGRKA